MSKTLANLVASTLMWAAAACMANDRVAPRTVAPPTRIPDPVTFTASPAGEPVTTAAMPRELRRTVVADAARRFNVAESSVVLTRAELVTWADASLGCPEPGRMYTQMLVSGYRVVAKTSAGELLYHTDSRGQAVSCAPSAPAARHGEDR